MDKNTIPKLNKLSKLIKQNRESSDFTSKMGIAVIMAGQLEFMCIQVYRTLEQIKIKQLIEENKPFPAPTSNQFFYDKKINSRKILEEVKKMLPLVFLKGSGDPEKHRELIADCNEKLISFVRESHKFLDNRNIMIHHLGNPQILFEEIENKLEENFEVFDKINSKQEVIKHLAPYTLDHEQRKKVYGE